MAGIIEGKYMKNCDYAIYIYVTESHNGSDREIEIFVGGNMT